MDDNKAPGCSSTGSCNSVLQPAKDCFMEMSETEQLNHLKQLIVCGRLTGELPDGFLSCFRSLPNELIVKIWSYLPIKDLREFRLVSKHWKSLWESIRCRRKSITKLSISRDTSNKLVLKAVANSYFGRQVEVAENAESLQQVFSLVTFPTDSDRYNNNCLIISGNAASEEVLRQLGRQNWNIQTIVFNGDLCNLKEEILYNFLQAICLQILENSRLCLHFQNVILPPQVITDRIIDVCGSKLMEIVIGLDSSSSDSQVISLTDRCLPNLIRDEVVAIIPSCSEITIGGITAALETFFKPARKEQVTGASDFFNRQTVTPRFCIGLSEKVTANKIAAIRIFVDNVLVSRTFHTPSGHTFHRGNNVKLEDMVDVGMVEFTYKNLTLSEYKTHLRRYSIEVATESNIRDYAHSLAVYDVAVRPNSQNSDELPSFGCPSEFSDMYSYNTPDNWSDENDYDFEDELEYGAGFIRM